MGWLDSVGMGFNNTGWSMQHGEYQGLLRSAMREQELLKKALTTGTGVVQPGATGGQTLRRQFLFNLLEATSFQQSDAILMKLCPKEKAWSTFLEWTTQDQYGQGGDGFVDETGSDGLFGVDYADDNYSRQTENVKFMAEGRQVGLVAQEVNNIQDPFKTSKVSLTRSLIGKANTAGYFADALTVNSQFNGIAAQLRSWADTNTFDYGIMYDCGGRPLDKYLLEDICVQNRNRFGRGDLLLMSTIAFGDSTTLIWPEMRQREGEGGAMGGQFRTFNGPNGPVKIADDPMLRAGRPLRVDGPGSDARPRTTASADTGSLAWAGNPWVAASGANGTQVVAPGTGNFWTNFTKNTDSGPAAVPALPSGSGDPNGGNNDNRLAAGSYYYGVSIVYKGKESALYIYGAGTQAANVISGTPTAVAVTAGNVAQLEFDTTTPQVTGLGTTYPRVNVKFRVYRAGGPGAAAPTRVSDFKYLCDCGTPTSGNARCFDNGFNMPGTDNAFLITTSKNGVKGWAYMQLLPLMQRMGLPALPLADPLVLLWFATILLRVRRHHVHIRNVGRT